MENICYIISGGDLYGPSIKKKGGDYIIAADAGYRHLEHLQMKCDLLLGDFDSLMSVPQHEYLMKLSKEKDDTDTLAAIRIGLERGFKEFRIYGATGGTRIDHTFANIQSLAFLLEHGAKGYLYDHSTVITMIHNDDLEFDENQKGYISIMSYSETASKVSICGLKYELENMNLKNSFPLGVSNEFIGKCSKISVGDGMLLITYEYEIEER